MRSFAKICTAVAVVIISVTCISAVAMAASQDMELVQAAWDRNVEKATLALNNGANPNAVVPVSGWTPLLSASWRGESQIAKALLDRGAQVNTKDPLGWTPLMVAAKRGHRDIAKTLIEGGADVNATSIRNATALILACEEGHPKVVELLLHNGAKINVKTVGGLTALSIARKNGNPDMLNLLLNSRATK